MEKEEESCDRAQSGEDHQDTRYGYLQWQKGIQACVRGNRAKAARNPGLSIAGCNLAGQQKSGSSAYVSK